MIVHSARQRMIATSHGSEKMETKVLDALVGSKSSNNAMKLESNIPILRATDDEVFPGNLRSRVILSGAATNWRNLIVEEHHVPHFEWNWGKFVHHVVGVNLGKPVTSEVKTRGRFRRILHKTGSISLFPSHHSHFARMNPGKNGFAHALYVVTESALVSEVAAELGVHPDAVELVGQHGIIDPALLHIAMALRDGLRAGRANDAMYGESLSLALAVHLLRRYAAVPAGLHRLRSGLSQEKLKLAVEYIQDQLESGLSVSRIARTVHMSPFHFARLFKQSTGKSPYQYVVQARAERAKELLKSGKFSIIEIAHRLGFADQSHLTRQLKDVFGATPKMLQAR
jgi:AraC family transcriptional regulator